MDQQNSHVKVWKDWLCEMADEYSHYANKMGGTPYAPRWRLIAKALREKVDREVAA